jgi:hypothetical protein
MKRAKLRIGLDAVLGLIGAVQWWGLGTLLLAAATVVLTGGGPGPDPAQEAAESTEAALRGGLSCPDGSCPRGFECIDGRCQGANHPGSFPFVGPLAMNTSCAYGSDYCNVSVDDVRARLNQILDGFDTSANVYSFRWEDACDKNSSSGCFVMNISDSWHFQSLMRFAKSSTDGSWLVTTRSVENGAGRIGVIRMASFNGSTLPWRGQSSQVGENKLVAWERVGGLRDGGFLNHASGAQMLGKVLFTGVECFKNSSCENRKAIVRIVDLSNPSSPVQRAFVQLDRGSADAAAARLTNGYLLMTHSDDGAIEGFNFYRSDHLETGWLKIGTWNPSLLTGIDHKFGCDGQSYQNLHLVTQSDGKLFLVGMCRDGVLSSDSDWADLYQIGSFTPDPVHGVGVPQITKVARRKVGTAHGASFYYGGGVYVDQHHRMSLYATEATTESDNRSVYINEFAAGARN